MPEKKKILRFIRSALLMLLVPAVLISALAVYIYFSKEKFAAQFIQSIEKDHGVRIRFRDVKVSVADHWPEVTVKLKHLEVTCEKSNPKQIPLLKAETFALSLNAMKLMQKQVEIKNILLKNAQVFLEKDENGGINCDFNFSDTKSSRNSFLMSVNKIIFRNVSFDFYNRVKQKHAGLVLSRNSLQLKWLGEAVSLKLKGDLNFNELLFKENKGPFLYNKKTDTHLELLYLKPGKRLLINGSSYTIIEKQKYHLSGLVFLDSLQQIALSIHADVKDFDRTLTVLNTKVQKSLALVKVKNPIQAKVFLLAKFNRDEDPLVKISFSGKNNSIMVGTEKIPYTHVNFTGEFRCMPDKTGVPDMDKAWLSLYNVKGKIYDVPFKGNIHIVNMKDPYLSTTAKLWIDTKKLKDKTPGGIELSGTCRARLKYEGPVESLGRSTFLKPPMKLSGDLEFHDLKYTTTASRLTFSLIGKASVQNDKIGLKELFLGTEGGNLKLAGNAGGFVSYLCGFRDGFTAEISATGNRLDITQLLKTVQQNTVVSKSDTQRVSKNNFDIRLVMQIRDLLIRKVRASNAYAELRYRDDVIEIGDLDFVTCGGSVLARGFIYNYSKAKADIEIRNVDVRDLFEQCEEFNQNAIQGANLKGTLSATGSIALNFKQGFSPDPKSIVAEVKAVIKNGHLVNYEPLQKISNFIFRKRNFKDVSFTSLYPNMSIKDGGVKFENMEIATNVFDFFMSGTYHFNDESSLNLVVPWSNIRHRGKDYIPQLSGKEGDSPKGLKLNVYGYPDKMKIRLGHRGN